MARRILALDLGSHTLKAALIESSLSRCRVVGLFQQRRVSERPLAEQLQDFCTSYQLQADTVLSCLPGNTVSHRLLTLPFTQPRQISQAVPFELESHIPFSLDEMVIADQTIQRTADGTQTLAVAVLKKMLAEHLDVLTTAGLDPRQIVLAPLALLALLPLARVDTSGFTALLDIGESHTSVVLLREGVLVGLRTFASRLNRTGDLAAFSQELRWTLLALSPEEFSFPQKIFLCGGGAHFPETRHEIERAVAVEVLSFSQLAIPLIAEAQQHNQAAFATCLGIGLHEALRGTTPMVNLRQGEFAPQRHNERVRQESGRLGWLAVGVAAAAALAFMLDVYRLNLRYQTLRQETRRVFVAALPDTQTIVNEKAQLADAVEALQRRQRLLHGSSTGSPLDVLRHLSAVVPEQVPLDLDAWTFDEDAIRLQGTTSSFEAAEAIKTAVVSLGVFREAQLKDVKTVAGSQKVAFGLQLFFHKNELQETKREVTAPEQRTEVKSPYLDIRRREG
jgi:general secretion pathway protein L